jgi:hypothetical protein
MRRFGFAFLLLFALAAVGQNIPIPYISQPLSPTTVPPGSQGFTLTVHGANFAPTAVLEWNGSQRKTVVISNALLQATVNTSDLNTAGFVSVTVVNLGSNSQTSNTALFTIRKAAPAVALTPDPYFSGSGIASVVGDFNGDGKPDVVTLNTNQGKGGIAINAYLGTGKSRFEPPIKSVFTGILVPVSLLAGDLNGDHLLDLLVITPQKFAVYFGDGKGKFTQGPIDGGGIGRRGGVYGVADVNGDGILDLLITVQIYGGGGYAAVWFGNGDGTFSGHVSIRVNNSAGSPVLGDFNEDGYLDLAVPDLGTGLIYVALNQGNGTFSTPVSYPLSVGSTIATADVNNDGHLDIVSDNAAVLLGNGDGTFTSGAGSTYSGTGPIIADFNGDGQVDLLFLNPLSLLLGNGDGTFQSAAVAGAGSPGAFGGVADFNEDGHLGLAGSSGVFRQVSAGLYPAALNYNPQTVGTSSPPQTANLYNAGSTPLNLTSIHIGGADTKDFTQTNNCPSSIPVGSRCQIQVTFTPTAVGNRQAQLVVAYTGVTSPQSVVLAGQGAAPQGMVSLKPSSLTFATQLVKTTSPPQTATLTNTGSSDVTVNSIYTSGPFGQTNNCPSTLPVGQSCKIQVTFSPTQNGTANGTLTVNDNAANSPQTVALSGVGTTLTFKPIGVNFGNQKVGTSSNPVSITFSNGGATALKVSSIALGGSNPGDFSQTNNCPRSLPAGGKCTIQVTFTPTQKGARSADLQVFDDANPSPQQAALGGTGT